MNTPYLYLLVLPLIISAVISYLLAPLSITIAKALHIIDDPKKHKHPKVIHTVPTPRGGGLGIFLAIVVTTLLFLPVDRHLLSIFIGAGLLLIMGLLDDKYNLHPYPRILLQFIAASLPIMAGIGINFFTNPLGGIVTIGQSEWIIADIFALIFIVALINFLNMGAKGIPGQLPGVVGIAAITIALLSFSFSADITEWPVTILAAVTAGAYLGFLPWNTFPQRIMPSFAGSNVAGYLLAVLAILTTTKVGTLLVVLAVPLLDTGYTIIRRVLSGKSPVWGDRGHLHHKLLDSGMSQKQVAFLYWGITAILGIAALGLNAAWKFYTIGGIGIFLGGLLLWLTYRKKS